MLISFLPLTLIVYSIWSMYILFNPRRVCKHRLWIGKYDP